MSESYSKYSIQVKGDDGAEFSLTSEDSDDVTLSLLMNERFVDSMSLSKREAQVVAQEMLKLVRIMDEGLE